MSASLLNRAKVRELALAVAKEHRPAANFSRVGRDFFEGVESAVRIAITNRVKMHPTRGITLT